MALARPTRLLIAALGATVGLTLVGAAPATAAETVHVSGTVVDYDDGYSLEDATVEFFTEDPVANPAAEPVSSQVVDGYYEADMPYGQYWQRGAAEGYDDFVWKMSYLGPDSGSPSIQLGLHAHRGTVTVDVVHEFDGPAECAWVQVYRGDREEPVGSFQPASDEDDDLGRVTFSLRAGEYKFRVSDDCGSGVGQWVGFAGVGGTWSDAPSRTVTKNGRLDLGQVTLDQGNRLSGVVTRSTAPKTPLSNVVVYVTADGGFYESTRTDSQGRYSITGLADGDHLVSAYDDLGEYEGLSNVPVSIQSGSNVRNLELAPIARGVDTSLVRGKVVDVAGKPIAGVGVCVTSGFDSCDDYVETRRDGTYGAQVDPGTYKIRFNAPDVDRGTPEFVSEWYDDALTELSARSVVVASKPVVANAVLTRLGVIKGTVKLGGTLPGRREVTVTLYDRDGDEVDQTRARTDGKYTFDQLLPGPYKVKVSPSGFFGPALAAFDETTYIRQFWTNKFSLASANAVVVRDGLATSNVDVSLTDRLSVDAAPRISGTAKKGKRLTATTGSWSKTVQVAFTYQWFRGSTAIPGARGTSYVLTKSDVKKQVRVVVTATDRTGVLKTGTAASAFTAKVK